MQIQGASVMLSWLGEELEYGLHYCSRSCPHLGPILPYSTLPYPEMPCPCLHSILPQLCPTARHQIRILPGQTSASLCTVSAGSQVNANGPYGPYATEPVQGGLRQFEWQFGLDCQLFSHCCNAIGLVLLIFCRFTYIQEYFCLFYVFHGIRQL